MGREYVGYVGTYTRESSEGIYRFTLDTEKAIMKDVQVAAKSGSPTYLTISDDKRYLYSVAQNDTLGGVQAYEINSESGELRYINEELTEGVSPCHLAVYENELVTGNYHQGTVELLQVNKRGGIETRSSTVHHNGSGTHERQEKPHVHYTAHTPEGKYIVAVDLGTDEVVTYTTTNNELASVNTLHVKSESGPRHLVFHPNGKTAYLLTELSSEVIVLDYDAATGAFTTRQTISTLPENFSGKNDASAIHISPDGKFVYTGNRGHDSIAVLSVDKDSSELTLVEHVQTGGEWPRDFVLDPTGKFIIVANQHSGNLVLFARDQETGMLTKLESEVDVPEGVCVKFIGE